ncbi:hypothetical protein RRG08_009622 [Elysia crispata]|uniref:Uncharacterized protein n=1 Tax=Elysia crispata TaxID=231223 RepID=A0AAE0XTI8_9GAST|nr:hypothetical protein RRG08_009622 [Elysia crispata]
MAGVTNPRNAAKIRAPSQPLDSSGSLTSASPPLVCLGNIKQFFVELKGSKKRRRGGVVEEGGRRKLKTKSYLKLSYTQLDYRQEKTERRRCRGRK